MNISSADKKKRLILLDTHAILHRAYHALPDFTSPAGEPTGALYGLTTMILKIVDELKPDYVVACYDLPQPTHRHEQYVNYKAGRAETDDALIHQIITSKKLLDAFAIPRYELAGFEADDLLATIVEQCKSNEDLEIVIASGDMDTLQLVNSKKVRVYTLKKGIKDTVIYDEDAVLERYGFLPAVLPDYKGLRGDPSDNIPGVKGIGEKIATSLIQACSTLELLYEGIENNNDEFINKLSSAGIKPRIINLLKEAKEEAFFSRMLATVRKDAPIQFDIPQQSWTESITLSQLTNACNEYGFKSLIPRIEKLKKQNNEASSLFTVLQDEVQEGEKDKSASTMFHEEVLKNTSTKKEFHDGFHEVEDKDTASLSDVSQENIDPFLFSQAQIMVWLLHSNVVNPTLEVIKETVIKKISENTDYNNIIIQDYNTKKAISFLDMINVLESEIKKEGLENVYRNIELPLISVVKEMNERGVKLDTSYINSLHARYSDELTAITHSVWNLSGVEFNISSPQQLGSILFEKLELVKKKIKKTSSGKISTAESELEKLKDAHPIIPLILEYREIQKLLSTYLEPLPKLVDNQQRLHTTYIQTGTTTGRLSSQSPNIQNIPVRSDRGSLIRNSFVAEEGNLLVAFDYSQIELRIAAMLSRDSKLIFAFNSGEDIHSRVAAEMFCVDPQSITKSQRSAAKTINFGILYGMGVNAVRANLGQSASREDAELFLERYKESFPQLMDYLESTKRFVVTHGYTETYFGRKRYFESIRSNLPYVRAQAERMAVNAPIQGTQADIIKKAMGHIDVMLKHDKRMNNSKEEGGVVSNVGLVMQIHDELVYELPAGNAEELALDIKCIMESVIPISETGGITFIADVRIGSSWGNMRTI